MLSKFVKKYIFSVEVFYFILVCVLWALPLWPMGLWWLANLISIVPLWFWLIPLVVFLPGAVISKTWSMVVLNSLSLIIIIFGIMGFKVNLPVKAAFDGPASLLELKVISANLGHISTIDPFIKLVIRENPDVIAFQELSGEYGDRFTKILRGDGWDVKYKNGGGLASRLNVHAVDTVARPPADGKGLIVTKYELAAPSGGTVYFFVVHLATPRDGVEAFISRSPHAVLRMQQVTAIQDRESRVVSDLAAQFQPVVVAGDFNMIELNPVFRMYWARFYDAFAQKGFGFGFTKHTRWYGARIDHILHDLSWRVLEARVGPDVSGDHHPLIVRLNLVGDAAVIPAFKMR